jgi:beta-aspartyl-peptidase (threonine type)
MFSLAIHGGAGAVTKETISAEQDPLFRKGLRNALDAGTAILSKGGSALDAVEAAVRALENDPLFNAGRGAVYTKKGVHEMDASIMDGSNLKAGAVAGVRNIKNPVSLARKVMEESGHVLLSGKGANEFALKVKAEMEPDDYFYTKFRYDQWLRVRHTDFYHLDHIVSEDPDRKFGTVGAVALDSHGHLAAATSTGGMLNKQYGRIGDSPIIGAGTYANDNTCAISCTGHGEFFIRYAASFDVHCLMEYKGLSLEEAVRTVIFDKLKPANAEGGMIAVDGKGNITLQFNALGMHRAYRTSDNHEYIALYGDE